MGYKKSPNISTKNILLAQIIFVAIIVGGIFLFDVYIKRGSFLADRSSQGKAVLLIDFDDMKRMFEGTVTDKMTVLDALNVSAAAGEIKLHYVVDRNNNTSITEINDHIAADNKNFSFYLNEKLIKTIDLNKILVNAGDRIIVKLE